MEGRCFLLTLRLKAKTLHVGMCHVPSTKVTPRGAVLNAKAVVHDNEQVFVASANLTPNALDQNIEAGLLVRDRSLAQTIASYFQRHMETGLVVPLPPVG